MFFIFGSEYFFVKFIFLQINAKNHENLLFSSVFRVFRRKGISYDFRTSIFFTCDNVRINPSKRFLASFLLNLFVFEAQCAELTYDFVGKSYDYFFEKRADFFYVSTQKSYILTWKKAILIIAKGTNRVFFISSFLSCRNFFEKTKWRFQDNACKL